METQRKSWRCKLKRGDFVRPIDMSRGDLCDRLILFGLRDGTEQRVHVDGGNAGDSITWSLDGKTGRFDLTEILWAKYDDDQDW